MACRGGCTGGPYSFNHMASNKMLIDLFAKKNSNVSITSSIKNFNNNETDK